MFYALTHRDTKAYMKENINFFIALSPVVVTHPFGMFWDVAKFFTNEIKWTLDYLCIYELFGFIFEELAKL